MILTLEVIGDQAAQLGAGRRKVFHSIGGTIGRLPDNDWVFPDPYVSGRHALIRYLNGRFFVEDTSTNGVFINSHDSRVSKTQAQSLNHGDVLFIDTYEIKVSIENEPADNQASRDPLAALQNHADRKRKPPASAPDDNRTVAMPKKQPADSHETQWMGLTEMQPPEPRPSPRIPEPHKPAASADSHRTVVLPRRPGSEPPDRNNETQWFGATEIQMPEPETPAAPKVVAVVPAAEAPAPSTELSAADHQAATHAAIRLAFETMLAQFDPNRLQEEFDRHMKKGSILGVPAKLRYWDLYREKYGEMIKDADASFRKLFDDEFAKAFADQVERLKSRGRSR